MATIGPRRADGTYPALYLDCAGREHARHFKRKLDAQRRLHEVTTSIITGAYVAPGAGRITFREYAEGWRAVRVHRYGTSVHVETALRRRVCPAIGDDLLEAIVASDIQALVRRWRRPQTSSATAPLTLQRAISATSCSAVGRNLSA
jgi:hypothetical protein